MNFPEKLKVLMFCNSITNYKLAKDLSISNSTVANWLDGKVKPIKGNIDRLAQYFRINPIFFDDDEEIAFPGYYDSLYESDRRAYLKNYLAANFSASEKKNTENITSIYDELSEMEMKLLDIFRSLNDTDQIILLGQALTLQKEEANEGSRSISVAAEEIPRKVSGK